jgi:23S rRNA (pseudouridine1915-N3)-methyltransferase
VKTVVLAAGRLREKFAQLGARLYADRIASSAPFEMIEVDDPKGADAEKTGSRLLSRIRDDDVVVLLSEGGTQFDSRRFAEFVDGVQRTGRGRLVFVVGGPYGVGRDLTKRANRLLSFGPMTLPHELARVVLLEQLYRAWSILRGSSYHHGDAP